MELKEFLYRNCLGDFAFSRDYLAIPFHVNHNGHSYVVASTGVIFIAVDTAADDYPPLDRHPFGKLFNFNNSNGKQFELAYLKNWLGNPSWPNFSCNNCKKFVPCPFCKNQPNLQRNSNNECAECDGVSEVICPNCDLTIPIEVNRICKINNDFFSQIHIARALDFFHDDIITVSTGIINVPFVQINGKNWFSFVAAVDKSYYPENPDAPFPKL